MSWLKEDIAAPDNFHPLCCGECTSAKQGCDVTMALPSARTCDGTCGLAEGTETYAPADVDTTHSTDWVRRRFQQQKQECNRTLWFVLIALFIISLLCMVSMTKKN